MKSISEAIRSLVLFAKRRSLCIATLPHIWSSFWTSLSAFHLLSSYILKKKTIKPVLSPGITVPLKKTIHKWIKITAKTGIYTNLSYVVFIFPKNMKNRKSMGSPYHYLDTEAWGFEGNAAVLSPADKEIYQVQCCFLWWLWYVLSPVDCALNWHILQMKTFADKKDTLSSPL